MENFQAIVFEVINSTETSKQRATWLQFSRNIDQFVAGMNRDIGPVGFASAVDGSGYCGKIV